MSDVNNNLNISVRDESLSGVDAVLDRMYQTVGKPLGVSIGMALEVPDHTVRTWRTRGSVPLKVLSAFAEKHRVSLDWLLHGATQYESSPQMATRLTMEDFVTVPRYDVQACAGHGVEIHSEQIVDYLAFRSDWVHNALGVNAKDLALISVKGDSMEPTLSNGDLILLDMHSGRVEDNAVYALQHNGTLMVKRIQRRMDGSVVVKSDNPRYEPETLPADAAAQLRVVGRVVWAGRRM